MSTYNPLGPDDFPVYALGEYVYRRSWSSPFVGPVSMHLAADIAFRLNRDHFAATRSNSPPHAEIWRVPAQGARTND